MRYIVQAIIAEGNALMWTWKTFLLQQAKCEVIMSGERVKTGRALSDRTQPPLILG